MPPYIDVISSLFSATVMRKKTPGEGSTKGTNGVNVLGSNPLNKNQAQKGERRYNQDTGRKTTNMGSMATSNIGGRSNAYGTNNTTA